MRKHLVARAGGLQAQARHDLTESLGVFARRKDSPRFWDMVAHLRQAIREAPRASSAVQTVHSNLRVYPMVKKDFSEDYFYVVALHYNMRPFAGGRKGRRPFELLGLELPTQDWIELLRRF